MKKALSATELARTLIRCRSVTPLDAGAQGYLDEVLSSLGLSCKRLPFGEISNLFARIGDEGPHFCFAGHTDVVPPGDESAWRYPPFAAEIEDGVLFGRGAVDMKGGIAAFVAAVAAFLDKHGAPNGSISLLITGDEEGEAVNGTVRVLEWMVENGHTPDVCLVGEPTNPSMLGEQIKIGRRGSLTGSITVKGRQGHVAYPHLADNPLPKLVALLERLSSHCFDEGTEFFPPTNLEIVTIDVGNKADNVIPSSGQARFNVRFNDKWTSSTLESEIRNCLDEEAIAYHLDTRAGAESFLTQPGEFTKLLAEAVADLTGMRPVFTTEGGTSDARFICKVCPVAEFGLINATAHHVDERIELKALERLAEIYLAVLEKYFGV
ncbi:MAG: succinyl-diaminopimelate desuccinylase [Alphaproteobacteria bacterium]|nr:succinyl-diaminopimelate desuccinylase [Alphaproteobacteria bacterium]